MNWIAGARLIDRADLPGVVAAAVGLGLLTTVATAWLLARYWIRYPERFAVVAPLNSASMGGLVYAMLQAVVAIAPSFPPGAPGVAAGVESLVHFVGLYLGPLAGLTLGVRLAIVERPGQRDLPGLLALAAMAVFSGAVGGVWAIVFGTIACVAAVLTGYFIRRLTRPTPNCGGAPPRRIHYAALALAYAALAVYGSLVPLDFHPVPRDEAWDRFKQIPWLELGIESRSDWVANILLFVPLGFLLMASLRADWRGWPSGLAAAAVVLPTCALLSLAVEYTQIHFPPRTVSQNDIAAEALGGALGAALWGMAGRRLTALARDFAATFSPSRRLDLVLQGYLVGLLIYSVLPLDLTISPADFWRRYRDGRILLFGVGGDGPAEVAYAVLSKVAVFVPVGLLAASRLPSRRGVGAAARGLVLGGILAAAIEVAQLMVYSRVTNGADVLWGALGTGLGAALGGRWGGVAPAAPAPPAGPRRAVAWIGLAAVYVAVLAGLFWMPFDFTGDRDLILARLHGLRRVPFEALYRGSDWSAMTQIARKMLWFAPLGALLAPACAAAVRRRLRVGAALAACLAVATGIELGQILLPNRVADPTDVLLYMLGATAGLLGTSRLLHPGLGGAMAMSAAPPGYGGPTS